MVASSSRSVQLIKVATQILTETSVDVTHIIIDYSIIMTCSIVELFEIVVSTYAQQLSLNETQNFTTLSLTLVVELVIISYLTAFMI